MLKMSRRFFRNATRSYASGTTALPKQVSLREFVLDDFVNFVPKVASKTLANATFLKSPMKARLQEIIEYYTPHRRPVQAEFMAFTYDFIENPKITNEILDQIKVLATTLELIQTYYFFWDDLEDGTAKRCGKQCWHLRPGIGLLAVNDACLLRSFINETIEQNFDGVLKTNILYLFNRNFFVSSTGQHYDTEATNARDFDKFTPELFSTIVEGKSEYFSVKCPVLTGLAFANKLTQESQNNVEHITAGLGKLVQIQNDMVDMCTTDDSISSKNGSDIQEGKCSWPAVMVLQRCSPAERRIFDENYGSWDPKNVERIRELYNKYDVLNLYREELISIREDYFRKVNDLPKNSTPSAEFFTNFYNLFNEYTKDIKLMYDQ